MEIGWRWRVSIDGVQVHEADIFPTSDGAGGWGVQWGTSWGQGPFGGGWGLQWGVNWGYGGGIVLTWTSEPVINGSYTVTTEIIDTAGNVSSSDTDLIDIESYARPVSDFAVVAYTLGTDTLDLSWTESPDF
jgi:hypothetical protein